MGRESLGGGRGSEEALHACLVLAGVQSGTSWAVIPPGPIYRDLPNTSIVPGKEM